MLDGKDCTVSMPEVGQSWTSGAFRDLASGVNPYCPVLTFLASQDNCGAHKTQAIARERERERAKTCQ